MNWQGTQSPPSYMKVDHGVLSELPKANRNAKQSHRGGRCEYHDDQCHGESDCVDDGFEGTKAPGS